MATGILSNGFWLMGTRGLSEFLWWVNLIAYPILLLGLLIRIACFRGDLWSDLTNPVLVFGFFTLVAASNVLGVQCFLRHYEGAAQALWLLGVIVWLVLGYFSFSVLTFLKTLPKAPDVVHGGWLIAIVGAQSCVLLGTFLAPRFGEQAILAFLGVHCLWGIGITLYGIFITLFSYRIFFVELEASDMNPLFWVVMGAAAISTNAGTALIRSTPPVPFLDALRPFVDGATLTLWAWSTWWIPLLIVFWIWRHLKYKTSVSYHPTYWSVVFPLGMYTVATYRLSLAADLALLKAIPAVTIWAAMGVWSLAMLGLMRRLVTAFWRIAVGDIGKGKYPATGGYRPTGGTK
jgi:tellurite resistance protein TehA-like permease